MKAKMKVKILFGLWVVFFVLGNCEEKNEGLMKKGDGSVSNPYQIGSARDLELVRNNLGKHFIVTKEIDLNKVANFSPIGSVDAPFRGTFDGRGKVIRNLEIDGLEEGYFGFFGAIGLGSIVRNMKLEDINVKGRGNVGGLVGYSRGTIQKSGITGSVGQVGGLVGASKNSYTKSKVIMRGKSYIGGLVGWNGGTIEKSYASVAVRGEKSIGGLVGWNGGTIKKSYATGSVTGVGYQVGGLVGINGGTIEKSYASGAVKGEESTGGLVGKNMGTIEKSYASGAVKGEGITGGLVGYNYEGRIQNSYATGSVRGNEKVGGLVGYNDNKNRYDDVGNIIIGVSFGIIKNSYASGDVKGEKGIGGLMGYNRGKVQNSYTTGNVKGNEKVGVFVGDNDKGTISGKSYWKGGSALLKGLGRGSGANVERKTDAELKALTAVTTGWSTLIWEFQAGEYPKLR